MHKKEALSAKRMEHFTSEKELFVGDTDGSKQAVILEDHADLKYDHGNYDEAIQLYEGCLMVSQEKGNLNLEAEV